MIFRYSEFKDECGERFFVPFVPVFLSLNNDSVFVDALIDSGADYTILPIQLAAEFGFKLSLANRIKIQGAGGNVFQVYKSPEKLGFLIKETGFRDIKWKSFVYFAELQSTILLGQVGFFDHVDVKLSWRKKEIEITN